MSAPSETPYVCSARGKRLSAGGEIGYLSVEVPKGERAISASPFSIGVPPCCNHPECIDRAWAEAKKRRVVGVETL